MKKYFFLIMLVIILCLVGCNRQICDYMASSSIGKDGFARNEQQINELNGQEMKLWGYIDHSNMYGDEGTQAILEDWWSGDGPDASTWRFNLKARENDEAGYSSPVYVPNDESRDNLLRLFLVDAQAQRPTKVFVIGRIFNIDEQTNIDTLTGLYIEIESSNDILLEPPERD